MKKVYKGDEELHELLVEKLAALSANNVGRITVKEPVNIESFKLKSENIGRIVPTVPTTIRFFPTSDISMVVAGSNFGHLGIWDVNSCDVNEGDKAVHLYQPHSAVVYGVLVHPFSLTKMYSCCGDGHLRLMNIEREQFDLVYSSNSGSSLYALSQKPNDINSMSIGEGRGGLNMCDVRAGKIINSWLLHEERINTVDVNPANTNLMATGSTDGLACVWDLRKMNDQDSECKAVKEFRRTRSIHSAYFSPSGNCLAMTSSAHEVAVLSGANLENVHVLHRGHSQESKFRASRAIWGWDDTYLYMGCTKRRVEVVSVLQGKTITTLESSLMSGVPGHIDAHPCSVGMLAGAICGGKVFLWTNDS